MFARTRTPGQEARPVQDRVTGEVTVSGRAETVEPRLLPMTEVDFRNY